jgi:septum formation protein
MPDYRFHLASASPRRLTLLRQVGLAPEVRVSSIREHPKTGESASDRVLRLATEKGETVADELGGGTRAVELVLAADTAVVVDGTVLGKPRDAEDATRMLRMLRGRNHTVMTGVWICRLDDGRKHAEVTRTTVRFRRYDDAWIDRYVSTGEPFDKAGAYGIQGAGALLVDSVDGSFTNVVGLPVERLPIWLDAIGVDALQLLG